MNLQPTTTGRRPAQKSVNGMTSTGATDGCTSSAKTSGPPELLADANFPGMERHPFALCGVSLPHFPEDPVYLPSDYDYDEDEGEICPECIEINGGLPEYLRT